MASSSSTRFFPFLARSIAKEWDGAVLGNTRLVDLYSGRPFWPDHSGPRTRYPSLQRHTCCDVAIIGGGYSGALVAYYLTAAGADVVLVDRRNVGMGSTAASTALIEYQLDAELHEFIKLAGKQAAVRSYRLSRDAIDVLEDVVMQLDDSCDWKRKKGLHIASSPSAVKAVELECRTRARHGFRVDFLTAGELAARHAVKAHGALLYHDAAEVNPFKLVHALIRNAKPGYLRPYARTEIKLGTGDALVIEAGEKHQITNVGRKRFKTLNLYAPPAY